MNHMLDHMVLDEETIMEEDCSYEEASDIFQEEREQSIEYWISFDIENKINELLKKDLLIQQKKFKIMKNGRTKINFK